MQQSSVKKYESKHDWVGKVIHWELSKKLKSNHTNKWYMHNSVSVFESETKKVPWDFEIQTDPGQMTRPSESKQKKKALLNGELCHPGRPQSKT